MLTYFQAETVIEALKLAKKFGDEVSTQEEDAKIDKAIAYINKAIKDGMSMGEHEDDIVEHSETDMTYYAMKKAYSGR